MIAKACLRQGSFAQEIEACRAPGRDPQRRRDSVAPAAATDLQHSDTTQLKRAIDMTDDELAAIASRATLHVVK